MALTPEKKKKIVKIFLTIAAVFFIIGFLPFWFSYRAGLNLAVYTAVIGFLVFIAIPNPDPAHEIYDPDAEKNSEEKVINIPK